MATVFPIPEGGMVEGTDVRIIQRVAGEDLSGQLVTVVGDDGKAYHADTTNLTHRPRVIGVTVGAISNGSTGGIQIFGLMTEPGWNWTMEENIYFTAAGILTQVIPVIGFILAVGYPMSSISMFINKGIPITIT